MELEKESSNLDYWNDLLVIVEDEVRAMRKLERSRKSEYEAAMGRQEGIHTSVVQEVASIFKNKTAPALLALKSSIEKKIAARQEGVDISYWESLLSQLKAHIARARLRDRHGANLKRKLEMLKAQQGLIDTAAAAAAAATDANRLIKIEPNADGDDADTEHPSTSRNNEDGDHAARPDADDDDDDGGDDEEEGVGHDRIENDMLEPCIIAYDSGRYSPVYLESGQIEPTQLIYSEEDDEARLEFARARVQGRGVAPDAMAEAEVSLEDRAMRNESQKGMSADEAIFSVESAIDKPVYLWSDKYRPRKPRYFNRVHTGFELSLIHI